MPMNKKSYYDFTSRCHFALHCIIFSHPFPFDKKKKKNNKVIRDTKSQTFFVL